MQYHNQNYVDRWIGLIQENCMMRNSEKQD